MKNLNSKLKLNKRLAGYSATAVALAAISSNADAQVAYSGLKNITVKMTNDSIDMDGNGVKDFAIINYQSGNYNYASIRNLQSSNRWMGTSRNVSDLASGRYVSSSNSFYSGKGGFLGAAYSSSSNKGNFPGWGDRYIGVRFSIGTDTHYGWIRVNIPSTVDSIIIKDWAYQKRAGYGIVTGDTAAPVLTGASVNHIGVDTANFNIATDKNTYLYYGVKKSTDPAPSSGEILADTSFITSDNSWISAGENTFQLSNLESDVSYTVYAFAIDNSYDTTTITHISFTTVDTIAPVLSAISVNNIHLTTAIAHLTSNEIGKAYFAVKKSTDPAPDATAIKTGTGFVVAGNANITAGTPHDFNLTGLTKATEYKVYMVAADTSNNISYVQNAGFTTANDVGIKKIKNEDVLLYPNPASDWLNITLPDKTAVYSVNDILGKTLLSGKLEAGNSKIDISGLVQGVYFVHLNFNGSSVVKQIIIK